MHGTMEFCKSEEDIFVVLYFQVCGKATCGPKSLSPKSRGWLQGGKGCEGAWPLALEVPRMRTAAGKDRLQAEYRILVHSTFGSRTKGICTIF